MHKIPSMMVDDSVIIKTHLADHLRYINRVKDKWDEELEEMTECSDSVYYTRETTDCAKLAAGSLLSLTRSVFKKEMDNGIALIRPPGHHAASDKSSGFCILNNVAIAANVLLSLGTKKVLIFDWDIHHGNGTQEIFYESQNVLVISVHRYDEGDFYPKGGLGAISNVGKGKGEGFNINIPMEGGKKTDEEFLYIFNRIVFPVAQEFNPDFVLVSAGFDASKNDPLGECSLSPETYGVMTHHLMSLANGRIVLTLEGGYNKDEVAKAVCECTSVLLGESPIMKKVTSTPSKKLIHSAECTISEISKYWDIFGARVIPNHKKILPEFSFNFKEAYRDYITNLLLGEKYSMKEIKLTKLENEMMCFSSMKADKENDYILMCFQYGTLGYEESRGDKLSINMAFLPYLQKTLALKYNVLLFLTESKKWFSNQEPDIRENIKKEMEKIIYMEVEKIVSKKGDIFIIAEGLPHLVLSKLLNEERIKTRMAFFFSDDGKLPRFKGGVEKKIKTVIPSDKEIKEQIRVARLYGECLSAGRTKIDILEETVLLFLDTVLECIKGLSMF
eukprot:GHVP01010734.1.p1 GENE.GHVP01010734.1~~GHVP01010734.1.p1  ORF type:complete len:647 (+),score=128.60 GHVP01010734.1:263-1942(+)